MTTTTPTSIDPDRLRRALHLNVVAHRTGDFTVGGWFVSALWGCCCPDRRIRGVVCKHMLATRLAPLDAEILNALREVIT